MEKRHYWNMQLHPNNQNWEREEELLRERKLIGLGDWEEAASQQKSFESTMQKGDIVLIKCGSTIIALVEVIGDYEYSDKTDDLVWFQRRRKIKVLDWYNSQYNFTVNPRKTLEQYQNKETNQFKSILKWTIMVEQKSHINNIQALLKTKKNIILQGAPGTGKTYTTAELAANLADPKFTGNHAAVMEKYSELQKSGQIGFVTFHQSMDYEDFVEGLKPEITEDDNINYKVEDGIFKLICNEARKKEGINIAEYIDKYLETIVGYAKKKEIPTITGKSKLYVWWNKGNSTISTRSVLSKSDKDPEYSPSPINIEKVKLQAIGEGEENNWRQYAQAFINAVINEYQLEDKKSNKPFILIIDEINRGNVSKIFGELITLLEADKRSAGDHPLSVTLPYSKERFEVPSNLYIIGTMNTTDRSVGTIDYAIRRRFAFVTLEASEDAINSYYEGKDTKYKALLLFNEVKEFLLKAKSDMDISDLMIGHSYFMAESIEALKMKLEYEIIPLVQEYFKDGVIAENPKEAIEEWKKLLY